MRKSAIKLIISILFFVASLLFLIFIPKDSNAGINVGYSTMYANINDSRYKFVKEFELKQSFNVGYSKLFDNNFWFQLQTNRLYNPANSISILANNLLMHGKSRLTSDSLFLGYRIDRFVPAIIVSNVELDKKLYYNNHFLAREVNHSEIYGLNISYLLSKNITTSAIYIAPNKELKLESAFGLSVNYSF